MTDVLVQEFDEAREVVAQPTPVTTTAELAECTCPEFCERDHDVD
jgi:hypothetical protein